MAIAGLPPVQTYIAYLDLIDSQPQAQAHQARLLDLLDVRPGQRLLDVGCGTGTAARRLAGLVGPAGRVTGLDRSPGMIAEARRRAAGRALPVDFQVGDAERLNFPAGLFAGCRVDRVLHHLSRPDRAVSELARVSRPCGRLVLVLPDFATFTIAGDDTGLPAALLRLRAQACPHPDLAGRLPALCRQAGLVDVRVAVFPARLTDYRLADALVGIVPALKQAVLANLVSFEAAVAWHERQVQASEAGRFSCSLASIIVSAVKP